MRNISRNFLKMIPKDVISFGQDVETKMLQETGIFPNPEPAISQLSATRQALVLAAANAKDGSLIQRQERNALTEQYKQELLQLSFYVTMAAANSAELMERSGYTLTKERVKPGIPHTIVGVVLKHTGYTGEVELDWSPSQDALSYTVQFREVGTEEWFAQTSTKSKATVSYLEPQKRYAFRVAAVGSAGLSPWSNEVLAFVL